LFASFLVVSKKGGLSHLNLSTGLWNLFMKSSSGGKVWPYSPWRNNDKAGENKWGETKKPLRRARGLHPWLLSLSPIVPVSGLVAPWRLNQVAGRFIGPDPSAPLY